MKAGILSAVFTLLIGMAIGSLLITSQTVTHFKLNCQLGEGNKNPRLIAACAQNAQGSTINDAIEQNGFGSVSMPWYFYLLWLAGLIVVLVAPETLGWMLGGAMLALIAFAVGLYVPYHTQENINWAVTHAL